MLYAFSGLQPLALRRRLNTGEIKWKVPLGEYAALKARSLPPTRTEKYGGPW
jgi:hypothetical protein